MADEKKTSEQNTKKPVKGQDNKQDAGENKVIAWFKKLPSRIATPFKNMANELKRVTWPSKQKLIRYSVLVLLFILFMSVLVGLLNLGATEVVRGLNSLAPKQNNTTNVTDLNGETDAVPPVTTGSDEADQSNEGPAETKEVPVETKEAPVETAEETKEAAAEETAEAPVETEEAAVETADGSKEAAVAEETVEVAKETEEAAKETEEAAKETEEAAKETEEAAKETEEAAKESEEVAGEKSLIEQLTGEWNFNGGIINANEDGTWNFTMGGKEYDHGTWTLNENGTFTVDSEEYKDYIVRYDAETDSLVEVDENGADVEGGAKFTR